MTDDLAARLLEMEKKALERWGKGDPGGFLEICGEEVVYFDPYLPRRIDGLEGLKEYYQTLWGQVHVDRFELLNPHVQIWGETAVLTFNYISTTGEEEDRWNCTEVYHQTEAGWRIIQTHWSYTDLFKNKLKM